MTTAEEQAVNDALMADEVFPLWRDDITQADIRLAIDRVLRAFASVRGELPPGDTRHGVNGYTNLGCRCLVCREANRKKVAAHRSGRKSLVRRNAPPSEEDGASGFRLN